MHDGTRELIEAAQGGDEAAREELMRLHLPMLRAFLRLRGDAAIRAADSTSNLVESVCREVIEHLADFEHRGQVSFRKWLCWSALRIIGSRKHAWRQQKRSTRRPYTIEADRRLLDCYATLCAPNHEAVLKEGMAQIEAMFQRLPADYREVILRSRVLLMSEAEIAGEMQISPRAVRMLLTQALARLDVVLREMGGEFGPTLSQP